MRGLSKFSRAILLLVFLLGPLLCAFACPFEALSLNHQSCCDGSRNTRQSENRRTEDQGKKNHQERSCCSVFLANKVSDNSQLAAISPAHLSIIPIALLFEHSFEDFLLVRVQEISFQRFSQKIPLLDLCIPLGANAPPLII